MVAIRVARAHTGRNRIGLFEGCYHGSSDAVLVGGQGLPAPEDSARVSRPATDMAGLPASATTDAVLMRYNDPQAVKEAVTQYGDELAAILIEPVLGGGGMIPAQAEFIDTIREETKRHGIVMICDEVITLRQAVGGAQAYLGVVPDLTTMGKIIGGGFPIGAVGGANDFMRILDAAEDGGVVANLGTFSANPISMHAGLSSMRLLDEATIANLNRLGQMTRDGLTAAIEKHHAPAQVTGTGSLFCIHWTVAPVREARVAQTASTELALLTYLGLCNRGIQSSARGIGCLSTPMDEDDIGRVVIAFEDTLTELQGEDWF
jgi:glutamate-1-semialdehyde 2,1-aminomutase